MQVTRALATYLRDHLAGSAAGVSLARRIADGAVEESERQEMQSIAADIEADRDILLELMGRLGVAPSRVKQAGAWLGEKIGALKLNASAPDRRLLQYESMIMGVTGKLELWRTLEHGANGSGGSGDPSLNRERIRRLAQRAEAQRGRLENLHGAAALALQRDA